MRLCVRSALVVAGAVMVLATAARVHVWGAERLLWQDAVRHSPEKPRPWINLGRLEALDGADAVAARAFVTAAVLARQPDRFRIEGPMRGGEVARFNLAVLRATQGRYDEALALTATIQPRSDHSRVTFLERQWRSEQQHGHSDAF